MEDKYINNHLFSDEHLVCSSIQSIHLLKWILIHFSIMILCVGLPISLFEFLPVIPDSWRSFVDANSYIYTIYICYAGIWLIILIIKLINKTTSTKKYRVYLTDKRLLVAYDDKIATILFSSITGVAKRDKYGDDYSGRVPIEIHTYAQVYDLDEMKNGNKLISLLIKVLFGATFKVKEEENKVSKKEEKHNKQIETKDPIDKVLEKNLLSKEEKK